MRRESRERSRNVSDRSAGGGLEELRQEDRLRVPAGERRIEHRVVERIRLGAEVDVDEDARGAASDSRAISFAWWRRGQGQRSSVARLLASMPTMTMSGRPASCGNRRARASEAAFSSGWSSPRGPQQDRRLRAPPAAAIHQPWRAAGAWASQSPSGRQDPARASRRAPGFRVGRRRRRPAIAAETEVDPGVEHFRGRGPPVPSPTSTPASTPTSAPPRPVSTPRSTPASTVAGAEIHAGSTPASTPASSGPAPRSTPASTPASTAPAPRSDAGIDAASAPTTRRDRRRASTPACTVPPDRYRHSSGRP